MTLEGVLAAAATPVILGSMIVAGAGYGVTFLWALDVRDCVRLYGIAVLPGLAFLSLLFALRLAAGTLSPVYPVLIVDWLIFANTAYLAVIGRRHLARRRRRRDGTGGQE